MNIKTKKDYYTTEVSIDLPVDVGSLDALMKSIKATGKIVIVYSNGGTIGINIEQKTKIPEANTTNIRDILGIVTKEL